MLVNVHSHHHIYAMRYILTHLHRPFQPFSLLHLYCIRSWHIFGASGIAFQTRPYPSSQIFHPHLFGSGRTVSCNNYWAQQQLTWYTALLTWSLKVSKVEESSSGNQPFPENRSFLHSFMFVHIRSLSPEKNLSRVGKAVFTFSCEELKEM